MMIITQKITSLAYEIHDGKNLEINFLPLKEILFKCTFIWETTLTFHSVFEEVREGSL